MDCFALRARNDGHCEERSDVAIHEINNMTLELRDISLRFSHKTVLQKLSVRFEDYQLHALLGENGAGKSTAANIICGELKPDSGELLLDDVPVSFATPRDAILSGICYVHQRPMLADSITVKENLLLGLNKEQKARLELVAQKWLQGVGLNCLVKDCGADVRFFIALTSALIKAPRVLILDEPSALLDDTQRDFLFTNLRELADGGMNIIIITHNYEEAQRFCDTICFIEDGKVGADKGSFDKLRNPTEKTSFLNLSKGQHAPQFITLHNITIQKGAITLIKGLAEDGLDEIEKELMGLRQKTGSLRLSKGHLAFIPTDRKFTGSNPNLTIEQMLTSALTIPENQKPELAKQMIKSSGVNIEPDEKCSCLSGGMLQKLMFERELYNNPELLILCNPLQGLDVNTCQKTCERIQTAAQNGAYVLVLSYGAFPSEYSDKEYHLVNGNLEAV